MKGKVTCQNCGWSWNKSDSSKKDMYICHECGRDNSNNMKNGGWLDSYADGGTMQEHQENYNNNSVSLPEGFVGMGNNTKGRNYSPAWGGQFQMGGNLRGTDLNVFDNMMGGKNNSQYETYGNDAASNLNSFNPHYTRINNLDYNKISSSDDQPYYRSNYEQSDRGYMPWHNTPAMSLGMSFEEISNTPIFKYLKENIETNPFFKIRLEDNPYYRLNTPDGNINYNTLNYYSNNEPSISNEKNTSPSWNIKQGNTRLKGRGGTYDDVNTTTDDINVVEQAKHKADIFNKSIEEKYGNSPNPKAQERARILRNDVEITPNYQMGGNVYPVNYVPQAQDGETMFKSPSIVENDYVEPTYSYPLRDKLYPGEDEYFKANPHVGGMAAEDNQVIINPYSPLSDEEKNAIRMNETARLAMRNGYKRPTFDLTPEQQEAFKNYSTNEQDQRETIIGRILSGDPSAKNVTPEQKKYAEELQKVLERSKDFSTGMSGMMKSKIGMGNAFEQPAIKRMSQAMPKTGMTPEGIGTHYMSSVDNYAVPELQDLGEEELTLVDPDSRSREAIRFDSPEEANYFAKHYKEVAPMSTTFRDLNSFQTGGSIPGAVGFTYARTKGIPSNGPYAKKTIASAQDGVDMYGAPITANLKYDQSVKRTNYNPRTNTMIFGYDMPYIQSQEEKDKTLAHENRHAWQFNNDRTNFDIVHNPEYAFQERLKKKPESPSTDEVFNTYHNRKQKEVELDVKAFKMNNPDLAFMPDEIVYKKFVDSMQYDNPSSLEGEAQYYENTGRQFQNGGEMRYYQHGLDWKPKGMKDGGWLDGYEKAQGGERLLPNNDRALQILANIQKRKQGKNTTSNVPSTKIKDERGEAIKKVDNTRTASKPKFTDLKKTNVRNKTKAELAEQERINDEAILADRKARMADSMKAQNENLIGNPNWKEVLARETQSTGDKFRLFPNDPNSFIDDWLNPAVMVGDMASSLGAAPYEMEQQESIMPLVTAIGVPLLTGGLEGIGAKSNKQFVNNLFNPVNMVPGYKSAERAIGQKLGNVRTSITPELRQGLRTNGPSFNSSELFDLNNVRKPSGSIGNQGATPEGANKILQSLGIEVKGATPNEVTLKEMVEHLKNNPKDASTYKKFLEKEPISVSELPGGEYHINDGHHRATLSYYSGNENIPTIIKNKGEYIKQKDGGIIKDDRGQWAHPGEITEIGSNNITMQGVPYDVLGISDTGDTKLMKPGKNYKFKGKKVTEFPMAKDGMRQEQKGLVNLDNLLNFTNYNKPQPGGWLSKYE